jgi:hypothetical protein
VPASADMMLRYCKVLPDNAVSLSDTVASIPLHHDTMGSVP